MFVTVAILNYSLCVLTAVEQKLQQITRMVQIIHWPPPMIVFFERSTAVPLRSRLGSLRKGNIPVVIYSRSLTRFTQLLRDD